MNVYIIGCSGFVGLTLAEYLAMGGHTVAGCGTSAPGFCDQNITYQAVDVCREVVDVPAGTDAVFYLAQSPYYQSFPEGADNLFGVNVLGVIKATRAALDRDVRLFCFSSSGNVYAPSFLPLREDHPIRRDNAYSLSKIMAEEVLDLFQGDMAIVSVRFFGVFGPGQRAMLPVTLRSAVENGKTICLEPSPVDENDDGGLKVSFSYSVDIAHCLTRLVELAMEGVSLPSRLNVAGPEPVSIRCFAETVGEILGKRPKFEVADQPREFDLVADISRLKSLLNPTFTPFEEGIRKTIGSSG